MPQPSPTHEQIEERAKRVETAMGVRLPVTLWMHLVSFTEDYLMAGGLLTLSRWRAAANDLELDAKSLRAAFDDTVEQLW